MCGIFGIIGEYDENKAKKALSSLSHRGPDYCGITQNKNLFFAHHRLSILDENSRSHQPLKNGKILLSFNGEIYNFKELKLSLASKYKFKTQSCKSLILLSEQPGKNRLKQFVCFLPDQ